MLDIITMIITLAVLGYVIQRFIRNRKKWFRYLAKIGHGTRKDIPALFFITFFIIIAAFSLGISIWIGKKIYQVNPVLWVISILVLWEIICIFVVLIIASIFVIIKEIRKVNDRLVNGILLYSAITILLQFIQFQKGYMESVDCSLLIDGVAYVFNMICIFHITGKTFEKEVYVKNVWSTMMINMAFIIIELSSMVYQVQQLPIENCFNQPMESFMDCVYYVLISFFTVGYGDLYPIDVRAKAISLIIVITGFLFTAVFFGIAMSVTTDRIQRKLEKRR